MTISNELKEKIERLISNKEMQKRILSGDSDAIREIGHIAQKGITPLDVIEAYENNTIDYLYKKSKKLIELNELYRELCGEYAPDIDEQDSEER